MDKNLGLNPEGTSEHVLKQANALYTKYCEFIEANKHRKIRVVRAVVFEGPLEGVLQQIARSLPEGTETRGSAGVSITVVQDDFEVVDG